MVKIFVPLNNPDKSRPEKEPPPDDTPQYIAFFFSAQELLFFLTAGAVLAAGGVAVSVMSGVGAGVFRADSSTTSVLIFTSEISQARAKISSMRLSISPLLVRVDESTIAPVATSITWITIVKVDPILPTDPVMILETPATAQSQLRIQSMYNLIIENPALPIFAAWRRAQPD